MQPCAPDQSPARTEPPGNVGLGAFFPTWVHFPNVSSTYSCWSQRSTGEDRQREAGTED